ncbi:hypothetical protein Q644_10820 [Brucella intermedia 229E]|uniref:Uncharacterized protein n=1 Tax=Brucella intermedia 229E TaxID=1337887 RepID=U4VL10_9HYPH|nr:hypothetical protein Q644_10820 [Brucella intermedia 229E]
MAAIGLDDADGVGAWLKHALAHRIGLAWCVWGWALASRLTEPVMVRSIPAGSTD